MQLTHKRHTGRFSAMSLAQGGYRRRRAAGIAPISRYRVHWAKQRLLRAGAPRRGHHGGVLTDGDSTAKMKDLAGVTQPQRHKPRGTKTQAKFQFNPIYAQHKLWRNYWQHSTAKPAAETSPATSFAMAERGAMANPWQSCPKLQDGRRTSSTDA